MISDNYSDDDEGFVSYQNQPEEKNAGAFSMPLDDSDEYDAHKGVKANLPTVSSNGGSKKSNLFKVDNAARNSVERAQKPPVNPGRQSNSSSYIRSSREVANSDKELSLPPLHRTE